MERKGDWIHTYTGKMFWPLDPKIEEINILDIAHNLSNICRFNGSCKTFYSVAQHSVLVSKAIDPSMAFAGLMHDGGEAYTGDIVRPIRRSLLEINTMVEKVQQMVYQAFEIQNLDQMEIDKADNILLSTEMRDLISASTKNWFEHGKYPPLKEKIIPLSPRDSEALFLHRYEELRKR